MKKLILANSFHGTRVTILAEEGISPYAVYQDLMAQAYACLDVEARRKARRKLARINRGLCGISGCKCGILR